MQKPSWRERLNYKFDNFMDKGTLALIAGLGVLSLVVILVAGTILYLARIRPEGEAELSFADAVWGSLMRTLDPGTMGGDSGWSFRLVAFAVTLGGIFIISALIGVLTGGLDERMQQLRKGRSRVLESGHTVILGWSPQIFPIIKELVVANANQPRSCIVILGNKDKLEMEEEIRNEVGPTGKTRVVCRSGDPISMLDVEKVSPQTSRAILILAPSKPNPDADVIKTLLAITNSPTRRSEPYHIVAELTDPKNLDVARIVGRHEVELVVVGEIVARIIAQTCRLSGLSVVYTELLDFAGDEIYFKREPALVGTTFGQALLAYEDSCVIGLARGDGQVLLNPSMDTRIEASDQIIVISRDDDTIHLSSLTAYDIDEAVICERPASLPEPEHILLLGWNHRAANVIRELDHYVATGSELTIVARTPQVAQVPEPLRSTLQHLAVSSQEGDTTDRRTLEALLPRAFDHIIVLSYSDELEVQEADALTLMSLLQLRDIAQRNGYDLSIVSEMLDLRNRELAEITKADDFVVSDALVSLMLAQVAENKHLNAVFADLFDPEGSEVYLKPAADYVQLGAPVNFYTVVEAARRRNEVAIGYREKAKASNAEQQYGVTLNPHKSGQITFDAKDRIVVLAEN
jgi:voltage-gated potassium channel Kch